MALVYSCLTQEAGQALLEAKHGRNPFAGGNSPSSSTGGTVGEPFPGGPFIGKCGFLTLANVEVEGVG